ncbi:MAG TPA: carboxypeptidase-like regulatory domain-containing protein [Acidobacteriaceae bacterium]|nr:carboxypeptidase-like regulatory domain-containing protein [Acidobacteriaceae bacterium]
MESRGLALSFRRRICGILFALLLGFSGFAALTVSNCAVAQDANALRTVQGKVVDKSGAGLKGATVYLKDSHTLAVKSYIAADDGSYRFGQLAQNTDYEVWAESGGKKSSVKNISSFDTRKEFDITLKIDK